MLIRNAEPADYARVIGEVDAWWGGRPMAPMLPKLFFVHFRDTSFAAEEDGARRRVPLRLPLADLRGRGVHPLRRRRPRAARRGDRPSALRAVLRGGRTTQRGARGHVARRTSSRWPSTAPSASRSSGSTTTTTGRAPRGPCCASGSSDFEVVITRSRDAALRRAASMGAWESPSTAGRSVCRRRSGCSGVPVSGRGAGEAAEATPGSACTAPCSSC